MMRTGKKIITAGTILALVLGDGMEQTDKEIIRLMMEH